MMFDLATEKCAACGRDMLVKGHREIFPVWCGSDKSFQMREKNVVEKSYNYIDNDPICVECDKKGLGRFKCSNCGELKSDKPECIELLAEPMCMDCYKTMTAYEWGEKVNEIEERHKWDHC